MLTYNAIMTGSDSLYESLYKCIKNDILQGKLCAGEKSAIKTQFHEKSGYKCDYFVENAYGQLSMKVIFIRCQTWLLCVRY